MEKVDVFANRGASFKVLSGTPQSQLAVMTLKPGTDSGSESGHPGDQLLLILEGTAELQVGGEQSTLAAGEATIIPARAQHRILNRSEADVFLVSVYAPPSY